MCECRAQGWCGGEGLAGPLGGGGSKPSLWARGYPAQPLAPLLVLLDAGSQARWRHRRAGGRTLRAT